MDVPLSLHGLLKEKNLKTIIRTVSPGSYYHLGLKKPLQKLSQSLLNDYETISVDVGIDGLPLYKSSSVSLWPILCKIINIPNIDVFLVGCFLGNKKPSDVDNYLHDFIYEIKDFMENGIILHGRKMQLQVRAFICDAPARAFLCNIVGHNSFIGCIKCYQVGTRVNNVNTFSSFSAVLRTDEDFYNRQQPAFHKQIHLNTHSALEKLGIKMITQFPLEPMHLVELGVTKKCFRYW